MKKTHLIIGTSAAGISAANKIRQLDPACEIICISNETELPYNKCHLADYVAGTKKENQVYTLSEQSAAQKDITLLLGKQVNSIMAADKRIELSDGQVIAYNSLLLGTGSGAIVPQIPGVTLPGVFVFHSLHDINNIKQYILRNNVRSVVVIGAGLTGLESADAFANLGLRVTVVERQPHVLGAFVNVHAAQFIERRMVQNNVSVLTGQSVVAVEGDVAVRGVRLADGTMHTADMVIIAVGVQSNTALARDAGLVCSVQGLVVTQYMQTSNPAIFAAGDVCQVKDLLTGQLVPSRTWPDAMLQGLMAAHAMVGDARVYPGMNVIISSHFFGIKFVSCGPILNPPNSCEQVTHVGDDYYHSYVLEDGYLKGFLLVGNTGALPKLRSALLTQTKINPDLL